MKNHGVLWSKKKTIIFLFPWSDFCYLTPLNKKPQQGLCKITACFGAKKTQ